MENRICNADYIRQISARTGKPLKLISLILDAGAAIVKENLDKGLSTVVFKGMTVYPATYNNQYTYPRARFGKYFKMTSPLS